MESGFLTPTQSEINLDSPLMQVPTNSPVHEEDRVIITLSMISAIEAENYFVSDEDISGSLASDESEISTSAIDPAIFQNYVEVFLATQKRIRGLDFHDIEAAKRLKLNN
jgi:hypothetical protein